MGHLAGRPRLHVPSPSRDVPRRHARHGSGDQAELRPANRREESVPLPRHYVHRDRLQRRGVDRCRQRPEPAGHAEASVTLLSDLALFAEGIVSPAALQKYGKDYAMHPTGSGPYKFDRWTKSVEFVESAYDRYWGGRPSVDRVIWKTV